MIGVIDLRISINSPRNKRRARPLIPLEAGAPARKDLYHARAFIALSSLPGPTPFRANANLMVAVFSRVVDTARKVASAGGNVVNVAVAVELTLP